MAEPPFLKPGEVYTSEPEVFGRFPVGTGLTVIGEPQTGPSGAEEEFAQHGSIALRFFVGVDSNIQDNTIDGSWTLAVGGSVLVRAKKGGFFMTDLDRDKDGWYVKLGNHKTRVTFNMERSRWVTSELV